MSTLTTCIAIAAGIALLVLIAYFNQLAENNKRRKARLKADLAERYQRTADLNELLAGQLMTPQIKLLLSKLQMHFAKQLVEADKRDNTYCAEIERLSKLIEMGEQITIRNPPIPVTTESQAQILRAQLEALHAQTARAAQAGLLSAEDALGWEKEIRHMLVSVYTDMYDAQVQKAMHEQQPGHARLALERCIQLLQKQTPNTRYQAQLVQLQKQLARINDLLLNSNHGNSESISELDKELGLIQDDWKKKTLYD
jgi:hypothetical protein